MSLAFSPLPLPPLAMASSLLQPLDWGVIAIYFAILVGVSWWVIRKNTDTADDYFLAGRHLPWWIVGASIFASNIGSEHVVGLAGSGATDGVAMAHYELHAWCLLVLAWVLVPFYMRTRVYTMPEFLEKRFGPSSRLTLTLVSLVLYVLSKVAVGIFAGGVVFGFLLPEMHLNIAFIHLDSFWVGCLTLLILTGLYTTLGGMRAVAYTETIQVVVLIVGSLLVTFMGLHKVGGWHGLKEALPADMFNLWKPIVAVGTQSTWAPVKEVDAVGKVVRQAWYFNGHYPWLGMIVCAPVIGLWYWCTCQYIVQRTLGAQNEQHARRGSILASFLKLLPVFIFIIPGMVCFALAKSGNIQGLKNMVDATGQPVREQLQFAFPSMVAHVLPVGVRGLVVAGLIAALMSSLAGVFNASSTLFTIDLYQKLRPNAPQHALVRMGRIATGCMVVIGILWIPVIKGSHGLYDYLQTVQGYLAPPIFVVFFLGIFWKRLNAKGSLAAMLVGFGLGLSRLAVDTPVALIKGFSYTHGSFLWVVNQIYFQYFSMLILAVSMVTMVVVSYATAEPDEARLEGLTFATLTQGQRDETRASWNWKDVTTSVLVVLIIAAVYLYFRN
jgi:solute:Na+ symporter, SSS family